MSVITRTRSSANATLDQSKSGLTAASGRVRAIPADARELTREAAAQARRQAYVTLGAGDVLVATVTRQRQELPAAAKQTVERIAEGTQTTIIRTTAALGERSADVVSSLRKVTPAATAARVRDAADLRTSQAKDAYAKLAVRGEQVGSDLRHDPIVARVIGMADTRTAMAADAVTSLAQKVRSRASTQATRESAATSSTPVRPTPARRVPAHKTTARKASTTEAPISATPTHRAAAEEAATRTAAAKKAAATRKTAAAEAAAKRKAAADKAAATRKKAAAERKQATETRRAAAAKGAATRKQNATSA